jgi:phthalate 4,5-dioxygenase oxygenase subunit
MDDTSHMLFFGFWDEAAALMDPTPYFPEGLDLDDMFSDATLAKPDWGQDREAMAKGHFSGISRSVLHEDLAVQLSMGPIVDRSLEHVCATDLAIVRGRSHLLKLIKRFQAGERVDGALGAYAAKRALPFSCVCPAGTDWRGEGMRMAAE